MADWIERFEKAGALWVHNGNPKRPHALLTSGNHSNGFFNGSRIIEDPALLRSATTDLVRTWQMGWGSGPRIERVVGSAFGAITLAYELGKQLRAKTGFTEPVEGCGEKLMSLHRFTMKPGETTLVVEDVITTGRTTQKTIAELEARGAIVTSAICALVNRSGKKVLDGRRIIALVDYPMPVWTPSECPLCKEGSETVRPKEHWDLLTAA